MSGTDDGRDEGYTDPTAPSYDDSASTRPPSPPTTELPLTPPSEPVTPAPDAGPQPWAPPPAYAQQPPPAYGQPPGRPDPYAPQPYAPQGYAPQDHGQQVYGQPGAGDAPQPYAAPGTYGQPPRTNGSALALTIISGLTTLSCCLFTAPALILGIVALTKQSTDPEGSARMTRYGWVAFAVAIALALVAVGIFVALGVGGYFDGPGTYQGY